MASANSPLRQFSKRCFSSVIGLLFPDMCNLKPSACRKKKVTFASGISSLMYLSAMFKSLLRSVTPIIDL